MTESENSERDIHEPVAFGRQLMLAREKAGMSVEEAARSLNLKEEMVVAIEGSEMDKLPPVAFVRGYVRTYAKVLGLPEERIIGEFEAEVPANEAELHPRSGLPDEADSQTPVIKLISAVIIVSAVAVLLYAIYSYYMERSERIEQAGLSPQDDRPSQFSAEAPSLQPPEDQVVDEPWVDKAVEADPDEQGVTQADEVAANGDSGDQPFGEAAEAPAEPVAAEVPWLEEPDSDVEAVAEVEDQGAAASVDPNTLSVPIVAPITGGDVLAVSAEQESWAEIVDANDIRLFYGMIEPGRDLALTGQAPFDVFLGNAPVVTLSLNATEIDMTKYIRSNNIAQFKVSVEDGQIRFH